MNSSSNKNILSREIESWNGFENALREENRILFHEMLNDCEIEYTNSVMALIFQQQKMINELITKLQHT